MGAEMRDEFGIEFFSVGGGIEGVAGAAPRGVALGPGRGDPVDLDRLAAALDHRQVVAVGIAIVGQDGIVQHLFVRCGGLGVVLGLRWLVARRIIVGAP